MATEISFTKRATAELSRCFNGFNINKSFSTTKKTNSCENNTLNNLNNFSAKYNQTMMGGNESSNKLNKNDTTKSNAENNDKQATNLVTNSVKSLSNAYEQNILAAKLVLQSPFKSPNKINNENIKSNCQKDSLNIKPSQILTVKPSSPNFDKKPPRAPPKTFRARLRNFLLSLQLLKPMTTKELWRDTNFLKRFFQEFSPVEKCTLAQVSSQWRDILYDDLDTWKQLNYTVYFNDIRNQPNANDIYDKIVNSLNKRQITALSLYSASDSDLVDFCSKKYSSNVLKRLTSCSFKIANVSDKGLEYFLAATNPNLYKLEISSCNDITDTGLWTGLVINLRSLVITDCINIADETLASISQMLPFLKEFTLQAYHVTDTGFSYFTTCNNSANKVKIKELNLISCWEITNQSLFYISKSMPKLKHLSLSGCSKISDDSVELIAEKMNNLVSLDLSWCSRITSACLEFLVCDLADQLKSLVLDRCIHITDQGLNYISSMTCLENLSLRWCPQIRDVGIQYLCKIKTLKTLSIAGCPLVTPHGITSLSNLPLLEELEITNCPQLTEDIYYYFKGIVFSKCDIIYN